MENKTKTVSGLVIPIDWDDDGTVLGAAIFDREERRYMIQQDEMGKELLNLIKTEVEVEGTVKKGKKGQMTLKVKDFWLKTEDNRRGLFELDRSERR